MQGIHTKITTSDELSGIVAKLHNEGKKIVHCHGVFDLVHIGHMRHLNSAKQFGDVLVVTTTADKHVKRGPGRPVFNDRLRAEALANLAATDIVCVIDHPTAIEAIKSIRPDFYVKGPDYKVREEDVTGKIFDEELAVQSCGGKIVFTEDPTFSSSKLLNLYIDSYPEQTLNYLKDMSVKYPMTDIIGWVEKASQLKVLVIGDAIIDQYHYCTAMGKSAKENIVAQRFVSAEDFAGGALATANHVAEVCPNVELLTILGEKDSYEEFIRSRLNERVTATFFHRPGARTTVKRRYVIDEDKKKLFEICTIDDQLLNKSEEAPILEALKDKVANYDVVIVNDFGHGFITRNIMEELCKNAKCLTLNAQTNSANIGFNLVTKYLRADFLCIDELEIRLAARDKHRDIRDLVRKIGSFLGTKQILVTRGPKGSISYMEEEPILESPALTDKAVDKVGAGDAFFAYASPLFAAGAPPDLVAFIGNAVGALKVQITGNREPVRLPDLLKFLTRITKL